MITSRQIHAILKQKAPFILVDKVTAFEKGKRITALKNITGSEWFAAMHFPENPVYPGIFIIEAIAQTTALLCALSAEESGQLWALGGLQRFDFYSPAYPGDTLILEVEAVKLCPSMAIVNACAKTTDRRIARGQLTFGVIENERT